MKVHAKVADVRISPRKALRVAALIRGKMATDALDILSYLPNKPARILRKLVASALANAMNNFDRSREEMRVERVDVGKGIHFRRVHPRARGRAFLIKRPTSTLRVVLQSREETHGAES